MKRSELIKEKITSFLMCAFGVLVLTFLVSGAIDHIMSLVQMPDLYKKYYQLDAQLVELKQEIKKVQTTVELHAYMLEDYMVGEE